MKSGNASRLQMLAHQKQALRQTCAQQRQVFAAQLEASLRPALRLTDRTAALGAWLYRHPAIVAGVVVAWAVWRPKLKTEAASGLLRRALWLWQGWRLVAPVVTPLLLAWTKPDAQAPTSRVKT